MSKTKYVPWGFKKNRIERSENIKRSHHTLRANIYSCTVSCSFIYLNVLFQDSGAHRISKLSLANPFSTIMYKRGVQVTSNTYHIRSIYIFLLIFMKQFFSCQQLKLFFDHFAYDEEKTQMNIPMSKTNSTARELA